VPWAGCDTLRDMSEPAAPYRHPITVRYLEVDRQGVVFNAWYLAWFDDAMTGWLAHAGAPYAELLDDGHDVQLVRTEIDWAGAVGFGDDVAVQVVPAEVGRTSFAVRFTVVKAGEPVVTGRTVYVCVAVDGSGKREVPPRLRAVLQEGIDPAPV
jgi:acyl-CoA thioester hydrolase